MTIWEIDNAISELIDPETGELLDFEKFEELSLERDSKIENMACWVVNMTAEAKAIREQEKVLADRRKALENKSERLKDYLGKILGGEKFKTAKVAVSYRKPSSIEVDEGFVDWALENAPQLLTYKTPEPSKTAIKDYLANAECEYARFSAGQSMTIK